LALIASEATDIVIQVETPSNIVLFDEGVVTFVSSPTVSWEIGDGNVISANLGFPVQAAHRHYYDLEPVTSDLQEYQVTSVSTAYMEDSLRVYINGVRINSQYEIYVPGNLTADAWTLNMFTPDHENGSFTLANALTSDDIIRVDFDVALSE